MTISEKRPLLLLFITFCYFSTLIHCNPYIESIDYRSNNVQADVVHKILLDISSAELLINENKSIVLSINPALSGTEAHSDVQIKFNCESGDENSFNWNHTNSNCSVVRLLDGYEFDFTPSKPNNRSLVMEATGQPGKQQLVAHARWNTGGNANSTNLDYSKAYITVNVGRSTTILVISAVVGWIYFAAWSISFYPQIWENFKRRSVVGLNFDYIALNITGFLSYSAYNIAIKYIPRVEDEFFHKHPRSQNPIELNDVVFGVHAVFATLIVILQCFLYERNNQTVSWFSKIFLTVVWIGYIALGFIVSFSSWISLLDVIYVFSYVKLTITLIKYIPQGYFNYRRKSTVGWSIGNIFLDFTGGLLSMFQMFLLAYNYDDWVTIMNNFTKFGLGFISILFDVFFLLQHYVFYRNRVEYSSHSALIGTSDGSDAFSEKDPSIPSLVYHSNFGYGTNDPINTNNTEAKLVVGSTAPQAPPPPPPGWKANPHPVQH